MKNTVSIWFRFLTFRATREELLNPTPTTLALGIVGIVLAGIGRWWDDPNVSLLQQLGLGSVAYSLILTVVLMSFIVPFTRQVRYRVVFGMVGLTSLPALLYAIPVERFLSETDAAIFNAIALGVVATYRVSLLSWFLLRVQLLRWWQATLAIVGCISAIGTGVFFLGYAPHILATMGGMRYENPVREQASQIGEGLAALSVLVFPIVIAVNLVYAYLSRRASQGKGSG